MTVTKEYDDSALRIKDGDKWIFLDAIPGPHNPLNIIVEGSAFTLSRDDLAAVHEWLGDQLSDFDERSKPVPLSEQVRALKPGTKFEYSSGRPWVGEAGTWFRTEKGATSEAGVESTDFSFFDRWADDYVGTIEVVG